MNEITTAPHLIDEPPMLVLPSLAVLLGINKAIILQQLHFLLNTQRKAKNKFNFVDGRWWVYNSYPQWHEEHFPWLVVSTLKRLFLELEKDGYVLSIQSVKHKSDRRKWYTIDYELWSKAQGGMVSKRDHLSSSQKDTTIVSKKDNGLSETTTEIEKKDIAPNGAVSAETPKKERQPDPVFDAVREYVFGITDETATGTRIAMIAHWLNGKNDGPKNCKVGFISTPAEAKHVIAFVRWWKHKNPDATTPRGFQKFVDNWREWAGSAKSGRTVGKDFSELGDSSKWTHEQWEQFNNGMREAQS